MLPGIRYTLGINLGTHKPLNTFFFVSLLETKFGTESLDLRVAANKVMSVLLYYMFILIPPY